MIFITIYVMYIRSSKFHKYQITVTPAFWAHYSCLTYYYRQPLTQYDNKQLTKQCLTRLNISDSTSVFLNISDSIENLLNTSVKNTKLTRFSLGRNFKILIASPQCFCRSTKDLAFTDDVRLETIVNAIRAAQSQMEQ